MRKELRFIGLSLCLLVFAGRPALAYDGGGELAADVKIERTRITWNPRIVTEQIFLTVRGPNGLELRRVFAPDVVPSLAIDGALAEVFSDGEYTYEMVVVAPVLEEAAAVPAGEASATEEEPEPQRRRIVQEGTFRVEAGELTRRALGEAAYFDQLIGDDLIVQGSLCVGTDCVNGENFSFDTIRLKENNTRIKFDDTSSSAGFPNTDWQLTANDAASGGQNKFSIEDITASRVPFTVAGGATTNSLYIASTGRIGFRTATPVLDLHVKTSNTPAMRLEQDNSGGFTAQTWDIGGNEANFFVRDVTGGSQLSFRIRPGAPSSSIDIASSGNVGFGTASPSANLHVQGASTAEGTVFKAVKGETTVLSADWLGNMLARSLTMNNSYENADLAMNIVDNQGTLDASDDVTLMTLNGQGFLSPRKILVSQSYASGEVVFLAINNQGTASFADDVVLFRLDGSGNLTTAGTVNGSSSVLLKENFVEVDEQDVLARLAALPITSWNYRADGDDVRHVGPMAEDFYAAFGLGADDAHIALLDASGVTMAAVQALHRQVQEQAARQDALESRNAALENRVAELEKLVRELAARQ